MAKYLVIKVTNKGVDLLEIRYNLQDTIIRLLEKGYTDEAIFLAKLKQLPLTVQRLSKKLGMQVACAKCLQEDPHCYGLYLITIKEGEE